MGTFFTESGQNLKKDSFTVDRDSFVCCLMCVNSRNSKSNNHSCQGTYYAML